MRPAEHTALAAMADSWDRVATRLGPDSLTAEVLRSCARELRDALTTVVEP